MFGVLVGMKMSVVMFLFAGCVGGCMVLHIWARVGCLCSKVSTLSLPINLQRRAEMNIFEWCSYVSPTGGGG